MRLPSSTRSSRARWVPLAEAAALAADGRLRDAKTITGLIWAQTRLQAEQRAEAAVRSRT